MGWAAPWEPFAGMAGKRMRGHFKTFVREWEQDRTYCIAGEKGVAR